MRIDFAITPVVSSIKSTVMGKSTGINTYDKNKTLNVDFSVELCFTLKISSSTAGKLHML